MVRSRFPGRPLRPHQRQRLRLLPIAPAPVPAPTPASAPDSDSHTPSVNKEKECDVSPSPTRTRNQSQTQNHGVSLSFQDEGDHDTKHPGTDDMKERPRQPAKKTVTFGGVFDDCSVKREPPSVPKIPISIIKKRPSTSDPVRTFRGILKPAKLTDLGSERLVRPRAATPPRGLRTSKRCALDRLSTPSSPELLKRPKLILGDKDGEDSSETAPRLGLFGTLAEGVAPSFRDAFAVEEQREENERERKEAEVSARLARETSDTPLTSEQSSTDSGSEGFESDGLGDSSSAEEDDDYGDRRVEVEDKTRPPARPLGGKVILREARLQLNSSSPTVNSSSEGPFSSFSVPVNASGNPPGTVTCGVCGAVRFYRFVRQARKFGIYSCESCRKFISKMIKKRNAVSQPSAVPILQCLKEEGNCHVPPIVRSQHWKLLRCAYRARCQACWLKMCVKAFQIPAALKTSLQAMLPAYMRPCSPVQQAAQSSPPYPMQTPSFADLSNGTDSQDVENVLPAKTVSKATVKKIAVEEETKISKSEKTMKLDIGETEKIVEKKKESELDKKRHHSKIKVKKKEKSSVKEQVSSTKRQKVELKGPRVKHVCRSASIVLGQPIATFPYVEEKYVSDDSDETPEDEKVKPAKKVVLPVLENKDEAVEPKLKSSNAPKDDESTDSFDSVLSSEANKENKKSVPDKIPEVQKEVQILNERSSQKKSKPVFNSLNIRGTSKLLQQKFDPNQQTNAVCMDFWESYDPEEVCKTGWGLISNVPFTVPAMCFLCGSKGKENLVHCASCCESYHPFCAETGPVSDNWLCPRCIQCSHCGQRDKGPASMRCRTCNKHYHSVCFIANRAVKYRSDWPQICNACLKCKSCDSFKVTKFLGNLSFCSSCFRLRQKGNYCPICQGVYQDNDFDSKMMECGWCSRWVHAQCEGLSGEGYQLLSALPHSVEYICKQCLPDNAPWKNILLTYLRGKLSNLLKSLAKNKNACSLLKLTPHKNTPVTNKSCLCKSPLAVRKLLFEDNSSQDFEKFSKKPKCDTNKPSNTKLIRDTHNSQSGNENLTSITSNMWTNKIRTLRDSSLQNSEICLTVGHCEQDCGATIQELREKYQVKDCCVRVRNLNTEKSLVSPDYQNGDEINDVEMKVVPGDNSYFTTSDDKLDNSNDMSHLDSPTLLEIKRRVNCNEYSTVKDFNRDMFDIITKTCPPEIKRVYIDIFTEAFPWFNCQSNCLNPSLEIDDDSEDNDSLKDEDMGDFSPNIEHRKNRTKNSESCEQLVPSLEKISRLQYEEMYSDLSLHDTRICILCKFTGDGDPSVEGRLLYCGQGDWIHANCALWSAEVFEEIDGSLQNVQSAISRGRMIKCSHCQNKGASVGCCAKNCGETYHFACARNSHCTFLDDKRVFCPSHIDEENKSNVQKEKDFELSRPVYVELDKKKKKYCEPDKIQFILGSLTVKNIGRIIPTVSDFDDYLIPVDFNCSRLYWSSKQPWKISKYTIRTKLLLVEPTPAYDLGVNITLDHSMNSATVDRILAEINSWHKSLQSDNRSLMSVRKDKSPLKNGTVSLEDFAVKQVMEHILDLVCRQDQSEDGPEEEPQNTADLLPPELKDAIFEDLNHDLLDGISMQDIFPKLMSYEDMIAIDLKNELGFGSEVKEIKSNDNVDENVKELGEISTQDKIKKTYQSNNNSENWLETKTSTQELLDDFLLNQSESAKDAKKRKTELVFNNANVKSVNNNKISNSKSDLRKCKINKQPLPKCEITNNVMVLDGTSDFMTLSTPKTKPDDNQNEMRKSWMDKSKSSGLNNIRDEESSDSADLNLNSIEDKKGDNSSIDDNHETTEQVIDFYTKIHCSPISQLDGADDNSNDSVSSTPHFSPNSKKKVENFSHIFQLDGADDASSSSCSDSGSPPRDSTGVVFYRPNTVENQFALTVAPTNTATISGDLVTRPMFNDNIYRISQADQTVKCDRCHCTYRNKDSFNRHLPNCDMMSTSESEGETPKSPETRTLTTLQNAFNTAQFVQPIYTSQQNAMYENNDHITMAKPKQLGARRTSVNTRQITINGTIVETQAPGPISPNKMNEYSFSSETLNQNYKNNIITDLSKISLSQAQIMPQSHIMVTPQIMNSVKNPTLASKQGFFQTQSGLPYNICVKPATGIQTLQSGNPTITQILPNTGNIQAVLSSNPNQVLTITSPQSNLVQGIQGKTPIISTFTNMQGNQNVSLPVNSIQGMPSSLNNNINSFVRSSLSFPTSTILMPTTCTTRMTPPNIQQKNQVILPQMTPKSPKKLQQVQPKPMFQVSSRGRGKSVNKSPTIKKQTKMDKPMGTMNQPISINAGNTVLQFQSNGNPNQPSIIVQQVPNSNIMSYVDAIQQQGQNMQYIATIAPQNDFKAAPTQFISQGGLLPQTFQIQQTESGLVAVPSGGIPVLLPQGGVGILPQNSLQPQSVTISPQGTAILPQTIQTPNGTGILSQGITQNNLQNSTQHLLQSNSLQSGNPTLVSQNNMNNSQSIVPQSNLQTQNNSLITQQSGTILPQGAILPQGLQFCNDQVLLGSTPTLEMVTDSSGCMYLTTQPVYYGLETIVQNTVMSSQQFVSTAMQGVLAQNSSFSATTTQVFQASKIEPIVEMPTGYVVVNNVPQDNIIVSQANTVNNQNMMPSQTISNNNIVVQSNPSVQQKNVKSLHGNINIQPSTDKMSVVNNRQSMKTMPIQPNQPILSLAPQQVGNTLSLQAIQPRIMVNPGNHGKQNINIQANVLPNGSIQIPVNSQNNQNHGPIHLTQSMIPNTIITSNGAKLQSNLSQINMPNLQDNLVGNQNQQTNASQSMRNNINQQPWRCGSNVIQISGLDVNNMKTQNSNHDIIVSGTPKSVMNSGSLSNTTNPIIFTSSVNNMASNVNTLFTQSSNNTSVSQMNLNSNNQEHLTSNGSSGNSVHSNSYTFSTSSSSIPLCSPYVIAGNTSQTMLSTCHNSKTSVGNIAQISDHHGNNSYININSDINKQQISLIPCGAYRNSSTLIADNQNTENENTMSTIPNSLSITSINDNKHFATPSSINSLRQSGFITTGNQNISCNTLPMSNMIRPGNNITIDPSTNHLQISNNSNMNMSINNSCGQMYNGISNQQQHHSVNQQNVNINHMQSHHNLVLSESLNNEQSPHKMQEENFNTTSNQMQINNSNNHMNLSDTIRLRNICNERQSINDGNQISIIDQSLKSGNVDKSQIQINQLSLNNSLNADVQQTISENRMTTRDCDMITENNQSYQTPEQIYVTNHSNQIEYRPPINQLQASNENIGSSVNNATNINEMSNLLNINQRLNSHNMFSNKSDMVNHSSNMPIAESESPKAMITNNQTKQLDPQAMNNQMRCIQLNNTHLMNYSDANHLSHIPNNLVANSQISTHQINHINSNQTNHDSLILKPHSDQTKVSTPDISLGMSMNSMRSLPPTHSAKQINLPHTNTLLNTPSSVNIISNHPISLHPNSSIGLIASPGLNSINLPIQNTSSINLPKAPPHQIGIPTNVVNPIPQSMRPMNRVLPIHRDTQVPKSNTKPKTPEAPKVSLPSHDMPDLNVKDDVVVQSEINKTLVESKHATITKSKKEEISKAISSSETKLTIQDRFIEKSMSDIKVDKLTSTICNAKMTTKENKGKENLSSLKCTQKLGLPKFKDTANLKLHSLAQRKIVRAKGNLENITNLKRPKQPTPKPPKDDGPKMIYEISSDDGFSYSSTSLSDLWNKVIETVQNARKQHGLSLIQTNTLHSLSGSHILGLYNNSLRYIIQQLPGAGCCKKYKTKNSCNTQNIWDTNSGILESFKESPWGCARSGAVIQKSSCDMFSWLASPYRAPPPPLNITLDTDLIPRRNASTTLPMAMRFRHLKETCMDFVGVYRSHIHGRGLFCRKDIEAGEMVIEYAGEVIRAALADQRERKYEAARGGKGFTGCYMFRIDDYFVVDATLKGNAARFINHSCDPNCYSKVVDILGHKHILIFALRRICQGEELTYDYKFPFEEVKIPCTCGAKKCRKYLN